MPKQPNRARPKPEQPPKSKKLPKTPNNFPNTPHTMTSPELMQPSTNSKPSYNRQLGQQPNLNPAREIFRRSHERIMTARAPKAQAAATGPITVSVFTERSIFEKLLSEHQDEILRLNKELAVQKQENAVLKANLLALQEGSSNKRKRLGGKLPELSLEN